MKLIKKIFLVLVVLLYAQTIANAALLIDRAAGTGGVGFAGDGLIATANGQFNFLNGIAADASGNFYIADLGNQRIRKVNANGILSTIAGTGTAGFTGDGNLAVNARMDSPYGVAADLAGNVYFSDYNNSRVRKIDTNGIITTVAGNGGQGFAGDGLSATANGNLYYPNGLAVDNFGNLYIADFGNNRIRKVDTNGIITTVAGNGTAGFAGDGLSATANGQLNGPVAVAVDTSGNIYISDRGNNRIRKVDTNGIITTVAGNGTAGFAGDGQSATVNGQLNTPEGIAVDALGNIYIADSGNHRIRKVNSNGIIRTIVGTGVSGGSGDGGFAIAARLNDPTGVALGLNQKFYIVDFFNNRVRMAYPDQIAFNISHGPTLNYTTIIGAVEAASANDRILIKSGTHLEETTITINKNLTLSSLSGQSTDVMIDGGNEFRVFVVTDNAVVTMSALTIQRGYVSSTGGDGSAINFSSGYLNLNNINISNNIIQSKSGIVYQAAGTTLNILNSVFNNNVSSQNENSTLFSFGYLNVSNSVFSQNQHMYGGAMALFGNFSISGNTITGNTGAAGGGIFVQFKTSPGNGSYGIIQRNIFSHNSSSASFGGGAIVLGTDNDVVNDSRLDLFNNIFSNNTALSGPGGAVANYANLTTVLNSQFNTFYGNQAADGGGLWTRSGTTTNVVNDIYFNNSAATGSQISHQGVFSIFYSDMPSGNSGIAGGFNFETAEGNITGNPSFAGISTDNFHLASVSAVIGRATTNVLTAIDYSGAARTLAYDMGAFNYFDSNAPTVTAISPFAGETNVLTDTAITLSITDETLVSFNSISITVNNLLVFKNGAAQNGYVVTFNSISQGYQFNISTNNAFSINQTVTVNVSAVDPKSNVSDQAYSFTTTAITSIIYLAPWGDDTTGNGTAANPYQTIPQALSVITDGGAIYFYPGTFTMNANENIFYNLTFSAYTGGGANSTNVIISGENTTRLFQLMAPTINVTFNEVTFTGASGSGGSVFNIGQSAIKLDLINVIASGNFASSQGGVIFSGYANQTGVTVNIINSLFTNNSSAQDGGVIYGFAFYNIVNSIFTQNRAQNGAVFYNNYATLANWNVINSYFNDNTATQDGGVLFGRINLSVTNSVFLNNRANTGSGGVVVFYEGSARFFDLTISGNYAGQNGGVFYGNSVPVTLNRVIIKGNRALNGGVISNLFNFTAINTLFYDNRATQNGGVAYNSNGTAFYNVTIVSNNAGTNGGVGSFGTYAIQNSILWRNTASSAIHFGNASGSISNSILQNLSYGSLTNGGNNLSGDPLFVSDSNFHLTDLSSAIDMGLNSNLPTSDIEGSPRIYGIAVDAGAYENQTHAFYLSDFSPSLGAISVVSGSAVTVRIRSIVSTLNIASVSFNINNILYTQSGPNTFNYVNNSSPTTGDITFTIQPITAFSYLSVVGVTINALDSLGNSVNNYAYSFTIQDTPFIHNTRTLQSYDNFAVAISDAVTGDTLFVDPGNRLISSTITVNKALTISANAGTTTLNGQNLIKIMHVSGVSLSILGLDFVSGNSNTSGALHLAAGSQVTINRVTFAGNRATGGIGSGGGAVGISGGATLNAQYVNFNNNINVSALGGGILNLGYLNISDSQIVSNSAAIAGGIANYTASGGIFNRLIVSGNYGAAATYGGAGFISVQSGPIDVANTLFIGNYGAAGTAFSSTVTTINIYNSTFVNNVGAIGLTASLGASRYANLFNNIFYNNGGTPFINGVTTQLVTNNMTYSYAENYLTSGTGNLLQSNVGTPNFVGNGNYALAANSPLINVGTNNIPVQFTNDITNFARTGTYDMGAYEYNVFVDNPPVITAVFPANNANNVSNSITLNFTISDDVALVTESLRVTINGRELHASVNITGTQPSFTVSYHFPKSLFTGTTYNVTASVMDSNNNTQTAAWSFRTFQIQTPSASAGYVSTYRDTQGNLVDMLIYDPELTVTYTVERPLAGGVNRMTLSDSILDNIFLNNGSINLSSIVITTNAQNLPTVLVPSTSQLAVLVNNAGGSIQVPIQMVSTSPSPAMLAVNLEDGSGLIRLLNYDLTQRTDLTSSYNNRIAAFNQTGNTVNFTVNAFSEYGLVGIQSVNFVTPNLSGAPGSVVTLTAQVLDTNSEGVSSAPVVFTIVSGPSLITQNVSTQSVVATTNSSGFASIYIEVSSNTTATTLSASLNLVTSNPLAVITRTFQTVVYLSPTGNDTTGDGSVGNPYETVAKGYAEVPVDGTIYLFPGVFTMNAEVVVTKSFTMQAYAGGGATSLNAILAANSTNRHFNFNSNGVIVTFNELTLSGGYQSDGGSIYVPATTVTLNLNFVRALDNIANEGGFLKADSTNPRIYVAHSLLANNNANINGGFGYAATWFINDSFVSGNTASSAGGMGYSGNWTINRSIIQGHNANSPGGVGYFGIWNVNNSILKNNSALRGGVGSNGTWTVNHSVMIGNHATTEGGVGDESTNWNITNSIIYNNTSSFSVPGFYAGSGTIKYSLINPAHLGGLTDGGNNINVDPLFVDESNGDYHLSFLSSLIDAGTSNVSVATDFENISRPKLDAYDIGAYEFHYLRTIPIIPTANQENVPTTTALVINLRDSDFNIVTPSIQVYLDGVLISPVITGSGTSVNLTYVPPGDLDNGKIYVVTVNATDGVDTIAHTYSFKTEEGPLLPIVYLSPTGNDITGDGSSGNPYETMVRGFTRVAVDGIINLYPGVFTMNAEIAVSKSFTLQSYTAGGATSVNAIVTANGTNRHFYFNVDGVTVTLNQITLRGAHATGIGGAGIANGGSILIAANAVTLNLYGVQALSNYANATGGFIYDTNNTTQINIFDSLISNNESNLDGGVGYQGMWQIYRSTFSNNTASNYGGVGINGTWIVNNSIFLDNNSAAFGGDHGTIANGGVWSIKNSVMRTYSRSAYQSDWTIENVTFLNSFSTESGTLNVINTIFGSGIFTNATGSIAYSLIPTGSNYASLIDNGGNIIADPLFVDSSNGNYHLSPLSPAINTGTSNVTVTNDIEGTPRPKFAAFDMGAYEYHYLLITPIVPTVSQDNVPTTSTLVIHLEDSDFNIVTTSIQVYFDNNLITPNITGSGTSINVSYTPPSVLNYNTTYSVTVNATDGVDVATLSYHFKTEAQLAVVNLTTSTNYFTIQAALNAASSGDTLEIFLSTPLVEDVIWPTTDDLTLRGLSSIPTPTIQGTGSGIVLDIQNNVSASVQNLIITGGNRSSGNGAGLAITNSNASVHFKNVYVSGNTNTAGGQGGAGLYIRGGATVVIEDSIFTNNHANASSGLGGAIYSDTLGTSHIEIYRTLISNNSAGAGGGATFLMSSVTIASTIIEHNTASGYSGAIDGGGIATLLSTVYLEGVTIADNTAGLNQAYGVLSADNAHVQIVNSILQNGGVNEAVTAFVGFGSGTGTLAINYSDVAGATGSETWWNSSNTTADPLFVNSSSGDYALQSSSPLSVVNGGTSNVQVTTDYTGLARTVSYSMGAFEFDIVSSGSPLIVLQSFEIDANGIRAPSANGYMGNDSDLVPGSQIVYKIQIVNTGNATANAVKIYQNIPDHTTFFNIPLNSGVTENSSVVDAAPDVDYFDGRGISPTNAWVGTLSGTPSGNITRMRFNIPEMAPSSSVTVRYSVTVD